MSPARVRTLLSVLLLLAGAALADDARQADEALLRENKVEPEDGLLAFLRKRTLSDDDRRQIEQLVRQLGERAFARRAKASRALVEWGPPALVALRRAKNDPDAEVARRVKECIDEIERGPGPALPQAAVRTLAARNTAGAVKALVDYVPFADDPAVEEEVLAALVALHPGRPRTDPDPALTAALGDALAERRAAAAYVLGRHPERAPRAAVEKLLTDPVPAVRLRAALGLVAGREKAAVGALIALLAADSPGLRWQAEDVLFRLAGERAPAAEGVTDDDAGRRKWRDAWAGWWSRHGDAVDLARLPERAPFRNLTVVPEMHANKVWEFGPDGKVRWELKGDLKTPIDAQVLPGGRVLVAELNGGRVSERDAKGRVLWQHAVTTPIACQRLPNGNTFIATNYHALVVTPAGKEVFSYKPEQGFFMHSVQRLANGHVVTVSMNGVVREVDAAGRVVRDVSIQAEGGSWSGIEGLPGNRYLVAGSSKVLEVDAAGKVQWRLDLAGACYARRLPNGNTLVVDNSRGLVEVDRKGKRVWERTMTTNLWRAHRR